QLPEFGALVEPAIRLASEGFRITESEVARLNAYQEDFRALNTRPNPFTRKKTWKAGDKLVQKDLARSLERIRDQGPAGFYQGETARLFLEEMQRGGGLISQADLDQYEAIWRQPVIGPYKNYRVISMPPPSSGGVALLQLLHILEHYQLESGDPASIHIQIEAMRRVYADRAQHLGDPDHYAVPLD
ncbi:gamma-glutamyltransferase, partial [Arthrospira platensis SPKY1]|nr:gamma-glutamyltransferase [Arthrospira platensis SPKY1]